MCGAAAAAAAVTHLKDLGDDLVHQLLLGSLQLLLSGLRAEADAAEAVRCCCQDLDMAGLRSAAGAGSWMYSPLGCF